MEPSLESLIDAAYGQLRAVQQSAEAVSGDPDSPGTTGAKSMEQEQLSQLLSQCLSQLQASAEVERLVKRLMRSRKIGRAPRGQALGGVYEEIGDRLQSELLQLLPESLTQYQSQRISAQDWSQALVTRASQAILDDAQLKRLALEAQSHPPQTPGRQHALMQLVEGIRLSGRLARPHRTKFSPQFYDLLYEEAVNRTLTYVCRRIETYDPKRGEKQKFMNWVNFRLDRMIIECRREFDDQQTESIPSLDDLDIAPEPDETESLADTIRECIATDAEQVFANAHIRNHPNASFQAIALARFDGKSWDDISQELAIKIPTLSSFFQRCCQKFAPIFHAYQ